MSRRFVAGETLDDAIATARKCNSLGMMASLDYLGENVSTTTDAQGYYHFDDLPMGNIDIAPTLASILGLDLTSHGDLRGRVLSEALVKNSATPPASTHGMAVSAPDSSGARTVLEYQESNGVRYYDRGCFVTAPKAPDSCAP